jgi:hypothetical protein
LEFGGSRRPLQEREEVASNRRQRLGSCWRGVHARLTKNLEQCVKAVRREGGVHVLVPQQWLLARLGEEARLQQVLADDVRFDRVDVVDLLDDASLGNFSELPPQLRTVAAEDRVCGGDIVDVVETEGADGRDQREHFANLPRVHSSTAQSKPHMRREPLSL